MFRIHFFNFGYSKHASTYAEALKLARKDGFEFTIWDMRDNTRMASYLVSGGFKEYKYNRLKFQPEMADK